MLSTNKIKKIIEYHNEGLSVRNIAKKARISKNTVQKYIKKYNNEVLQLTIPPEEKFYPIAYTHSTLQKRSGLILPKENPAFHFPVNHFIQLQYRREQEKWEEERRRKLDQEYKEKLLNKLKMELYTIEQERKRQEEQKKIDYLNEKNQKKIESDKKMNIKMQKLEDKVNKKSQERQKLINSVPRIVNEELKKIKNQQSREKGNQKDNDQIYKPRYTVLKPVEKGINTESDSSPVMEGIILGGIQVMSKFINFYLSTDRDIPMNSPEFWIQLSKYLKDDYKK